MQLKGQLRSLTLLATITFAAFTIAGCLPAEKGEASFDGDASGPTGDGGNSPPTISGSPADAVTIGDSYSFSPDASDPDGDPLSFSVENKPGWADFDESTGQLSGSPTLGDVGDYASIRITVTDGEASASTNPFAISVIQMGTVSTTLTWTPPTENEDGTPLMDLAGYRIYWGRDPGSYTNSVTLNNPGMSSYVVENLAPGTYEFVATSFNDAGVESAYSNAVTKDLN